MKLLPGADCSNGEDKKGLSNLGDYSEPSTSYGTGCC